MQPQRPLRVAYVSPGPHLYGAERAMLETIRHLDRARFAPCLVTTQAGALEDEARKAGVEIHRMPWLVETPEQGRLAMASATLRFSWWLRRASIDLVELNFTGLTTLLYPLAGARLAGRSVVFRNRTHMARLPRSHKWLLRRRSLLMPLSRASVSHWYEESDPRWQQVLARSLRVVPVTRDIASLDRVARAPELLRALGVPEGVPVVGIVAAIEPHKGQDLFLRAAALVSKRLPEARFVIVGSPLAGSATAFEASLYGLARDLGLADRVIFTGYRDDGTALLKNFDALVLTSRQEAFSGTAIEAMAMGVPVVAARVDGLPEIIEHEKTGLLIRGDEPGDYARAVIGLLTDEARAARLAGAARLAVERFDSARVTREIERCYLEPALDARALS